MDSLLFILVPSAMLAMGILWRRMREQEFQARRTLLRLLNATWSGSIAAFFVFADLVQNSEGYANHYALWASMFFWIATANELFGSTQRQSVL